MKLYVCWGTFPEPVFGHPCRVAHRALTDAGHDPELVRAYGWKVLPDLVNRTAGRREVKELTGDITVPVLVTDDGEVVAESEAIVAWAAAHPARAADPA